MSDTIHRVNHEIRQRRLEVLRVTDLTPRMRRITLGVRNWKALPASALTTM